MAYECAVKSTNRCVKLSFQAFAKQVHPDCSYSEEVKADGLCLLLVARTVSDTMARMTAYVAAHAALSAHGCSPMMHIVSRARVSFSSTMPLEAQQSFLSGMHQLLQHMSHISSWEVALTLQTPRTQLPFLLGMGVCVLHLAHLTSIDRGNTRHIAIRSPSIGPTAS